MGDRQAFLSMIKERCTFLHDYQSFKENLMLPLNEHISHDASAVCLAKGVGFDQQAIHYGYPVEWLLNWINVDLKATPRLRRYWVEGPGRGYLTLRSQDLLEDFHESEDFRELYEPTGHRDATLSVFFDRAGQAMGLYSCNRFSNLPLFSTEERDFFDRIAPYVFYAFLKYRWLLDIDFFNVPDMDDLNFGLITADRRGRITSINQTARHLLQTAHGSVPGLLPEELKSSAEAAEQAFLKDDHPCFAYRETRTSLSYGSAVCLRFDESLARQLPIDAGSTDWVIVIKPAPAENPEASFSKRELDVASLLCSGQPDKEIAHSLSISEKTVQTYIQSIFRKLGVANRTEAAVKALRIVIG